MFIYIPIHLDLQTIVQGVGKFVFCGHTWSLCTQIHVDDDRSFVFAKNAVVVTIRIDRVAIRFTWGKS